MKTGELVSSLFLLGVGILLSIWSSSYQIGGLAQPGAGFLPLVLGLLLCLFSIILLAQAWTSSSHKEKQKTTSIPEGWRKMAYIVLIVTLAALFFERLGYLISVFLMIGLLMLGTQSGSIKKSLLTALLTTLGVYVVFILILEQPFPRGLLRF